MKLSRNNLSFQTPVYERLMPFSPLNNKSHNWDWNQSQILSEHSTQFSRTRTSSAFNLISWLKPYYMKLSRNNLSFQTPVYERLMPFSPLNNKSHNWGWKQSQILPEHSTQFSRTRTSSNKGRPKKNVIFPLSISYILPKKHKFPLLTFKSENFTVKTEGIFLCNFKCV